MDRDGEKREEGGTDRMEGVSVCVCVGESVCVCFEWVGKAWRQKRRRVGKVFTCVCGVGLRWYGCVSAA